MFQQANHPIRNELPGDLKEKTPQPNTSLPVSNRIPQRENVDDQRAAELAKNQEDIVPTSLQTSSNTMPQSSPSTQVDTNKLTSPVFPASEASRPVSPAERIGNTQELEVQPTTASLTNRPQKLPETKVEGIKTRNSRDPRRARNLRSQSPPGSRNQGGTSDRGQYRERYRSHLGVPMKPPSKQMVPEYRDDSPWRVILAEHHEFGSSDLLPSLDSFWDAFYDRPKIRGDEYPSTTMLHIMDIAHLLVKHFNRFTAFVEERENFYREIDRYLANRAKPSTYKAWQECMVDNKVAVRHYMEALLAFVHNMQQHLIRKPLLRIMREEKSNAEFTEHLCSLRSKPDVIRIDQADYRFRLIQLNDYREQ